MSPLKRRQFGQLAAASLTSTILADLSSKALAQKSEPSQEIVYGVNLLSASKDQNRENQTPSVELNVAELATGRVFSKANVPVLSIENNLSSLPKIPRAFFLPDYDRITKLIVLADGSVVISTVSSTRNGYFNHFIPIVGLTSAVESVNKAKFTAKKVLGFERSNQTVESLLSLPKNQLLCLVGTEGIPPFSFRTLDFSTGKILSGEELSLPPLPLTHRFANLCQDLKGNIFATEIGSEGIPILITMNLQEKAIVTGKVKIKRLTPLTIEGRPLINDVKDLNFSSSGQLYALTADKSGKNNAIFTVDVKSGKMGLVREFAAEKFVFSKALSNALL